MHHYREKLDKTENVSEIFEIVKDAVREAIGDSRAGLDLGLMELGNAKNNWLGAFYPVGSNIIVMNKTPLRRIMETEPQLMKPYIFHVLMHEYLHSLGFVDEPSCRILTFNICRKIFGNKHTATEMSRDITRFMPYIAYPDGFPQIDRDINNIEIVPGFDRGDEIYIG